MRSKRAIVNQLMNEAAGMLGVERALVFTRAKEASDTLKAITKHPGSFQISPYKNNSWTLSWWLSDSLVYKTIDIYTNDWCMGVEPLVEIYENIEKKIEQA